MHRSNKGCLAYRGCVVADLLYWGGITGDPALLQIRGINQNANIGADVNVIHPMEQREV